MNPFARHHVYAPLLRRFNSKTSTSGTRVAALSPELVMHTYRMWFKMKAAVEQASNQAMYQAPRYLMMMMKRISLFSQLGLSMMMMIISLSSHLGLCLMMAMRISLFAHLGL
jgi:hypothetical protein